MNTLDELEGSAPRKPNSAYTTVSPEIWDYAAKVAISDTRSMSFVWRQLIELGYAQTKRMAAKRQAAASRND